MQQNCGSVCLLAALYSQGSTDIGRKDFIGILALRYRTLVDK